MKLTGTSRVFFARTVMGLALAVVFASAFLWGKAAWGTATLVLLLIGAVEWGRLGGFNWPQSIAYMLSILALSGVSLALLDHRGVGGDNLYTTGLLFWLIVAPLALLGIRVKSDMGHAIMGALVLLCTWTAIMDLYENNPHLLLFAVALVALYDSSAMILGKKYGRKRLAPNVSPNKTWEGIAGGVLVAHCAALALWVYQDGAFPLIAVICFTLILLVMSVMGDLYESTLKRAAKVSDSGKILMSHGGVLDRVDGMLPVIPFVALVDQSLGLSY